MAHSKIRAALFACALALSAAGAHAAPVTYNFTGQVSSISVFKGAFMGGGWEYGVAEAEIAGRRVALASQVIGTFTYDAADAEVFTDVDPNAPGSDVSYNLGTLKLQYKVITQNGFEHNAIGGGAADVKNDRPGDALRIQSYTFEVEQGMTLRSLTGLYFNDATGTLLQSGLMPAEINTSFPSLLDHSFLNGSYYANEGATSFHFGASLTSLERVNVSAVPEPSAYLMLLAGLGAIGMATRRQRRSPKVIG
jgi:hypothetical protein